MSGIIGKKIGMSQIFDENRRVIPVTYLSIEPNTIVRTKNNEKDGYNAVILGIDKLKKPKKNRLYRTIKEFKIEDISLCNTNSDIDINSLSDIKKVTITSFSKGKGFQGVMKRYNFAGGPKTHGSTFHRKPGSVGACAQPGRVRKGQKMAGRMGNDQITLRNRKVVLIDKEKKLIAIKGPVPGAKDSIVLIKY